MSVSLLNVVDNIIKAFTRFKATIRGLKLEFFEKPHWTKIALQAAFRVEKGNEDCSLTKSLNGPILTKKIYIIRSFGALVNQNSKNLS